MTPGGRGSWFKNYLKQESMKKNRCLEEKRQTDH